MRQHIIKLFAWVAFTTLFSFSPIGGESYTIHVNGKIVVQHHISSSAQEPSFTLDRTAQNGQLSVYYNECGRIGKERSLVIKDEKNNTLKKWSYANATEDHTPMTCNIKDIFALKQKGNEKLKLYYASRDVSNERLLATITLKDELKARK